MCIRDRLYLYSRERTWTSKNRISLLSSIPHRAGWKCRSILSFFPAGTRNLSGASPGAQYLDSVEELIARPVIIAFEAQNAVLHGAGREDIDARMIGSGRPFILEVVEPKKRSLDLAWLEQEINRTAVGRVAVTIKRWSERAEVETLKSNKAHKKYRILVGVDGALSADEFANALKTLQGATIHQRTPERVAHRRADKIRERIVLDIEYT